MEKVSEGIYRVEEDSTRDRMVYKALGSLDELKWRAGLSTKPWTGENHIFSPVPFSVSNILSGEAEGLEDGEEAYDLESVYHHSLAEGYSFDGSWFSGIESAYESNIE